MLYRPTNLKIVTIKIYPRAYDHITFRPLSLVLQKQSFLGRRAFSLAGPKLWNSFLARPIMFVLLSWRTQSMVTAEIYCLATE